MTSKAECEEAARQLGLSDTEAEIENYLNFPPYCYYHYNKLFFNTGAATAACTSGVEKNCICKNTMYHKVTSGSNCKRVTSKAECEEAARQLGLSDTEAHVEAPTPDYPKYCYYHGGSLYFNDNADGTSTCGHADIRYRDE